MEISEAIEMLEQLEYDYTIHKFGASRYMCFIDPEYGFRMELMLTRARSAGTTLSSTIIECIEFSQRLEMLDEICFGGQ